MSHDPTVPVDPTAPTAPTQADPTTPTRPAEQPYAYPQVPQPTNPQHAATEPTTAVPQMAPPTGAPVGSAPVLPAPVPGGPAGWAPEASFQRPWRSSTTVFGIATLALLGCNLLVHAWNVVNNLRGRAYLQDRDLDGLLSVSDLADTIRPLSILLVVLTAIALPVWLHHTWTSDRSDPSCYTRSTGLAVGGFFIPLGAYVLGPLALRDLWRGTSVARPGDDGRDRVIGTPPLVLAWIVCWGVANLLLTASRQMTNAAERSVTDLDVLIDKLGSALLTEAVASGFVVLAAVLLGMTVARIMSFTRR